MAKASFVLALIFLVIWQYTSGYWNPPPPDPYVPTEFESPEDFTRWKATMSPHKVSCDNPPISDRIVVVLKTGATEAYAKLPTQLLTGLRCVDHLVIVSDLEQTIGGHHAHDVLINVNASIQGKAPEFKLYRLQKQLSEDGMLKDLMDAFKTANIPADAPWRLDKYKFLHMLDKAWELKPDKDWYVFVETDTFLVWSNLLEWLAQLDPKEKFYIGSPVTLMGEVFGHGGSGVILSSAAIRKFVVKNSGLATSWDSQMASGCCGDVELSKAASQLGMNLSGAWPMLGGEPPLKIPYGPSVWCEPVITMHHMSSRQVDAVHSLAGRFNGKQPMLFKDVYQHFFPHGIADTAPNWDNHPPGTEFKLPGAEAQVDSLSFSNCGEACEANPICLSYTFRPGECHIYSVFTLGQAFESSDGNNWQSGWKRDRIYEWLEKHQTCKEPNWIQISTENRKHGRMG